MNPWLWCESPVLVTDMWQAGIPKCFLIRWQKTGVRVYVSVTQSCLTLCDPMDCSPPGSSVHGILQARILEQVAIPFSRESSWPRDRNCVSCIADRFFTIWATKEAHIQEQCPLFTKGALEWSWVWILLCHFLVAWPQANHLISLSLFSQLSKQWCSYYLLGWYKSNAVLHCWTLAFDVGIPSSMWLCYTSF